jgi:Kef-type K+ transport system membrane component KefB
LVLAGALTTSLIGLSPVFGAFIVGAVLSSNAEFREAVSRRMTDFMTVFFLPIFFTYTPACGPRSAGSTRHGCGRFVGW